MHYGFIGEGYFQAVLSNRYILLVTKNTSRVFLCKSVSRLLHSQAWLREAVSFMATLWHVSSTYYVKCTKIWVSWNNIRKTVLLNESCNNCIRVLFVIFRETFLIIGVRDTNYVAVGYTTPRQVVSLYNIIYFS